MPLESTSEIDHRTQMGAVAPRWPTVQIVTVEDQALKTSTQLPQQQGVRRLPQMGVGIPGIREHVHDTTAFPPGGSPIFADFLPRKPGFFYFFESETLSGHYPDFSRYFVDFPGLLPPLQAPREPASTPHA